MPQSRTSPARLRHHQRIGTTERTSSKTSSETAEQTRLADGPAVRYKAKVQFELVVEKGGMTLPPITSVDGTMVVRTPAPVRTITS